MKKNLRKVPREVLARLRQIEDDSIVVACSVEFKQADLRKGILRHLGVRLTADGLNFAPRVVPPANQGKYSDRNVNGEVIVRKDLPMQEKYNSVETPNWGDPYYGTHTVELPYKAYQREFKAPRETEIMIHPANRNPGLPAYLISFRLNDVLRRGSRGFRKQLLEDLNLLQENVGACSVEAARTPLENYTKSLRLSWEILPPGSREDALERLFRGAQPSKEMKDVAADRYDFFMTLRPQKLVFGRSGFSRYFGALIRKDLVVFENIEYGNAIYVMFKEWPELSKRTRIELLSGKFGDAFERVLHLKGWKARVRSIIKLRLRVAAARPTGRA